MGAYKEPFAPSGPCRGCTAPSRTHPNNLWLLTGFYNLENTVTQSHDQALNALALREHRSSQFQLFCSHMSHTEHGSQAHRRKAPLPGSVALKQSNHCGGHLCSEWLWPLCQLVLLKVKGRWPISHTDKARRRSQMYKVRCVRAQPHLGLGSNHEATLPLATRGWLCDRMHLQQLFGIPATPNMFALMIFSQLEEKKLATYFIKIEHLAIRCQPFECFLTRDVTIASAEKPGGCIFGWMLAWSIHPSQASLLPKAFTTYKWPIF